LKEIFDENDIPAVLPVIPPCSPSRSALNQSVVSVNWAVSDHDLYLSLAEKAIKRGVMPDYDSREPWFMCYSHSDADVDETLNVYAEIVKEVKK